MLEGSVKVNTQAPSILPKARPVGTSAAPNPSGDRADIGGNGPNLKECALMVAVGTGAGFVQSQMGGWSFPLAAAGGAIAYGGIERFKASRQEDKSTLELATGAGALVGGIVSTAGFVGAQVGNSLGFNPLISAALTSTVAVAAMKIAG